MVERYFQCIPSEGIPGRPCEKCLKAGCECSYVPVAATQGSQVSYPRDDGENILDSGDPASEPQITQARTADVYNHVTCWPLPGSNQTSSDYMDPSGLLSTVAAPLDYLEDFQQSQIYSTYGTGHPRHHAPIMYNPAPWSVPVHDNSRYYTLPGQLPFPPSIPEPSGGSAIGYMYESSTYVRPAENRSVPSSVLGLAIDNLSYGSAIIVLSSARLVACAISIIRTSVKPSARVWYMLHDRCAPSSSSLLRSMQHLRYVLQGQCPCFAAPYGKRRTRVIFLFDFINDIVIFLCSNIV